MANTAYATDPVEYRDIHVTVCRYRRQGLVCSTCTAVIERAERARSTVQIPEKLVS